MAFGERKLTGFHTKKRKPLKRSTLKSKSTLNRSTIDSKAKKTKKRQSVRLLKDKLWREVKRITRTRWGNTCYTCNAPNLESTNLHSGHGKPMGALPLRFKYDIRNIRPQCMVCNIHRGGMQDIFIAKLEQEPEGLAFLNEACYLDVDSNAWRIRQDIPQLGGRDATIFIENLLEQYRNSYL